MWSSNVCEQGQLGLKKAVMHDFPTDERVVRMKIRITLVEALQRKRFVLQKMIQVVVGTMCVCVCV